jgi:hypothetical protein
MVAINPSLAQVESDLAYWSLVTLNKNYDSGLRFQLVTSQRFADQLSDFKTNLVRSSIGHDLPLRLKNFSIWQGYDWFSFYDDNISHEHRIWQQLLYQKQLKQMTLVSRTRLEERILEGQGEIVRLRHLIRADYRIKKKLRLIGGAEVFVNLNSNHLVDEALDQNRLITGLGLDINSQLALDLIYMLQHNNRDDDALNHTFVSNLIFTL